MTGDEQRHRANIGQDFDLVFVEWRCGDSLLNLSVP